MTDNNTIDFKPVNRSRVKSKTKNKQNINNNSMTSNKPYLIRAIYQWIEDNNCTAFIHLHALHGEVTVPVEYIERDGTILLNISATAVADLVLGNTTIEFYARFKGVAHYIHFPVAAVISIYAKENGKGMSFALSNNNGGGDDNNGGGGNRKTKKSNSDANTNSNNKPNGNNKIAHLRVIK